MTSRQGALPLRAVLEHLAAAQGDGSVRLRYRKLDRFLRAKGPARVRELAQSAAALETLRDVSDLRFPSRPPVRAAMCKAILFAIATRPGWTSIRDVARDAAIAIPTARRAALYLETLGRVAVKTVHRGQMLVVRVDGWCGRGGEA